MSFRPSLMGIVVLGAILTYMFPLPGFAQIDGVLICEQEWESSSISGAWQAVASDGSDASPVLNPQLGTNWYSYGPSGGVGSDFVTVTLTGPTNFNFYHVELVPESNGLFGFEGLTVSVVNQGGTTVNQQAFNLLPSGAVSLDIYFPAGTAGNQLVLTFENHIDTGSGGFDNILIYTCLNGTPPCNTLCPGNGIDSDLDGLNDDCEDCLGTDSDEMDTDEDGMPDGYEYEWRYNPLDSLDGPADDDGNGLTNIEECQLQSNPRIADSPNRVYMLGDSTVSPERGTQEYPFKSLASAVNAINALPNRDGPITLCFSKKSFWGDSLILPDDIYLVGVDVPDNPVFNDYSSIRGEDLVLGENTTIRNILFYPGDVGYRYYR